MINNKIKVSYMVEVDDYFDSTEDFYSKHPLSFITKVNGEQFLGNCHICNGIITSVDNYTLSKNGLICERCE